MVLLRAGCAAQKLLLPLRIAQIATDYDLILAGMEVAATNYGYLASRLARKPFIAWTHTSFHKHEGHLTPLDRKLCHLVYRKTNCVVLPSAGARDSLSLWIGGTPPKAEWFVIENFLPSPPTEDVETALLPHWMRSKPVVLAIGRLAAVKAFDRLIRAHASLLEQGVDHHLVILGEGPERQRLEKEAARISVHTTTFLPGHIDKIFPWLRAATVFALCSHYEGLPVVLIEALSAGLMVVAMDCPSGQGKFWAKAKTVS